MVKQYTGRLLLPLVISFLFSQPAAAITIDDFEGSGGVESSDGNPAYASYAASTAIGGARELMTQRTSGTLGVRLNTVAGVLAHSQDSFVIGISEVTWDGSSDHTTFEADGLGGLDLTQDGATAIVLRNTDAERATNVTIRVYDASSPSGDIYWEATSQLNGIAPEITLPFSSFVAGGQATNPASFVNVGAIQLFIDGFNARTDIDIDWIGTNGDCEDLPNAQGVVIDDCGFCVSDANFQAPKDDCGICIGQPNYGNSKDECDLCPGDSGYQNGKDECNLCPADPNYRNAKDDCGVCFGNNEDRDDCGVCNGNNAAKDDCGVCFGNNEAKDDCGVCFGKNVGVDDCGVCGGNNEDKDVCGICSGDGTSCLDCLGIPGGSAVVDICGVCDGDGTSCLDCDGVPYGTAAPDRCGVCGGDGTSCLLCEENDLSPLLNAIKEKSLDQKRTNVLFLRKIISTDDTPFRKRVKKRNRALYKELVGYIDTLSTTALECANVELCVQQEVNVGVLGESVNNSDILYKLSRRIFRKLRNAKSGGVCEGSIEDCEKRVKRRQQELRTYRREARRLRNENRELIGSYPQVETVCQ